ncbi:AbgT family transporter [Propioniciclava coleopterorum]|uniref:AbgT family transporter n=1 Tax=Propioniciclava coleopterorum TaxID=2714937 RepID=UPI0019812534|nr:AbgT family transporter [Propioniciclava coleopterorum]
MTAATPDTEASGPSEKGMLAAIERIGNKVPPPALMFAYLILLVIVLSWGLNLAGCPSPRASPFRWSRVPRRSTTTRTPPSRG